jgi:UDP-N-acetylmuramyl pentapeptide synthase
MQRIASSLQKDDVVLLKGSRGIQLERIVEQLQSLQTKVSLQ